MLADDRVYSVAAARFLPLQARFDAAGIPCRVEREIVTPPTGGDFLHHDSRRLHHLQLSLWGTQARNTVRNTLAALQEHFHIIKYQRGNQPTPVLGYQCRRCWFWVICASTADLDPIKQCQDHLALGHFESMCATCPTRSTPSACPVRWHTMSWSCPRCQRPHTNVS